jgi:DNA-directed RNA polymerase specialized sigma24 family protein
MQRVRLALNKTMETRPGPPVQFAIQPIERYGNQLHDLLARRLSRPHEIEVLVQETSVALLRALHTALVANPRAYVLQVAANALPRLSKPETVRRRFLEVDPELADFADENPAGAAPDAPAERLSSQAHLNAALAKLASIFQAVLLMHL